MILGYRLRELRKENKLSQERLGKILGVSKVSVSGYESGNRIPSLEILNKILNFFDFFKLNNHFSDNNLILYMIFCVSAVFAVCCIIELLRQMLFGRLFDVILLFF